MITTKIKKKILILDQGDWFSYRKTFPLITAAKALGFEALVISTTDRFLADEDRRFIVKDPVCLSDIEKIISDINAQNIFWIGWTTEELSSIGAMLSAKLSLSSVSYDCVDNCSSKWLLAKALLNHQLPCLKTERIKDLTDFDNFSIWNEIIVKPARQFGGIAKEPWDYKRFTSTIDLKNWLINQNQLERFLNFSKVNEKENFPIIQEFIDSTFSPDVHIVYGEKLEQSQIYFRGQTTTEKPPLGYHIVESWGPVVYSPAVEKDIQQVIQLFFDLGFRQHFANLQFVIKNDRAYLIDHNNRISGLWAYMYKWMMPDFFEQSLKLFAGNDFFFRNAKNFYLKTPFWLQAGRTLNSIQLPAYDHENIVISYADKLVSGYQVPESQHSIAPSPQICVFGDSLTDCQNRISSFLSQVQITYLESQR